MSERDAYRIRDAEARHHVEQALHYKRVIDETVARQSDAIRQQLLPTTQALDEWIETMFKLADAVDVSESDKILERDRHTLPSEIETLKKDIDKERNPLKKLKLRSALKVREGLLAKLQIIDENRRQVEAKLQETLKSLEKVYTLVDSIDQKQAGES